MEVYINETEQDINTNDVEKILDIIQETLNEEIIAAIYLDDMEVNQEVLVDNKSSLGPNSTLKFETKQVTDLINEILDEVDDYLPKLKQGVIDTANLFRNKELEEARSNYELCLRGFEWYIEVLQRILSLLDDEELRKSGEEVIVDFNQQLNDLMRKLEIKDYETAAELLEIDFVNHIKQFQDLNQQFIDELE